VVLAILAIGITALLSWAFRNPSSPPSPESVSASSSSTPVETPVRAPEKASEMAKDVAVVPQKHRLRAQRTAQASSCREIATVHFVANSAELLPDEIAALREGFTQAGELSGKLEIFAYCDDIGAAKWNSILSQRRANAVAKMVTSIQPDLQLETRGFGSQDPVVPNRTWKARAKNRRAEVRVCSPQLAK
jgi:outer membrane protein OmpA-like peptidoglycan-associated protein